MASGGRATAPRPDDVDLLDPDEPGIPAEERERRQAAVDERNQGRRES